MARGSGIDSKGQYLFSNLINEFGSSDRVRVLDFGCNYGELGRALTSDYGLDIWGCDITNNWDVNDENSKKLRQIETTPYRIPFENNSFDVVISSSVFEHVHNKEEAFVEIHRVLKPGGFAIHIFPPKHYLPAEPHLDVPLVNFFLPTVPVLWLKAFAFLGFRKKYGGAQSKETSWRQIVEENVAYCNEHLSYWTTRQYNALSLEVFGNFRWPMSLYIENAKSSSFARLAQKLPFKSLSGLICREFRMALLVNQKK